MYKDGKKVVEGEDSWAAIAMAGVIEASDDQEMSSTASCTDGSFEDYPAQETYRGRVHAPDFSSWPDAATYRTAITKDVARGVNFAGAYIVSTWGMPAVDDHRHIGFAIVDGRNGTILTYGQTEVYDVDFRSESSLLLLESGKGSSGLLVENGKVSECAR
jgi:hypothetical protein